MIHQLFKKNAIVSEVGFAVQIFIFMYRKYYLCIEICHAYYPLCHYPPPLLPLLPLLPPPTVPQLSAILGLSVVSACSTLELTKKDSESRLL